MNQFLRLVAVILCGTNQAVGAPTEPALVSDPPTIRLDGRFDDWDTAPGVAFATSEHVYLRLAMAEAFTLQGSERTTHLLLDVDGKSNTGKADGADDSRLGVDLEVLFSPPTTTSSKRDSKPGLELRHYDDSGLFDRISHATVGLAFAPTFASTQYEFRLSRATTLKEPAGSRFRASSLLRARFRIEEGGKTWFESPILDIALPPATPRALTATIPPRSPNSVRIVSWNVEWEAPEKNPAPFQRIWKALEPDVFHLQEWRIDESSLLAWFSAHLPSPTPWRAHTYKDLGVSIVTRLPMTPATTKRLLPAHEVDGKKRQPIRFVAARIESPIGELLSGSMHLKCCGAKDTYEDRLRLAQTEAIREFVHGLLANDSALLPVLSGDMNLVGTYEPLARLSAGLDADGSDLTSAEAYLPSGDAMYTWNDAQSPFSPGRLDYLLHPDSKTTATSFVFDVSQLAPTARSLAGLEEADGHASDHLPLVVDLVKTPVAASARSLIPMNGSELRTLASDGSADVTLVNLWATTCIPCVRELPDLLRVVKEREGKVRLILISCDSKDDSEKAAALLARLGVDFTSYLKTGSDQDFIEAIDPAWEGTLPVTLVFGRDGKKRTMHQGSASYEEFVELADAHASDSD